MAYVPVPKDLTKVKTKVMFNLTRRQLVCFTSGALVGVPLFLCCLLYTSGFRGHDSGCPPFSLFFLAIVRFVRQWPIEGRCGE